MRNILIAVSLLILNTQNPLAQDRFVDVDYSQYYDWFHERSQVGQLYTGGTTLYTFTENTPVHESPCQQSEVVTQLPLGYPVENIEYTTDYLPEDEIDGYGDIWYQVKGKRPNGEEFYGYIWGADIAKAWQKADLYEQATPVFMMLGIASEPRQSFSDIKAEIKIVDGRELLSQTTVPGLCIFEDCASSALLRTIPHPTLDDVKIVEASTMTITCTAGIEKTYFYWNGSSLELVYHTEITTGEAYAQNAFVVNQTEAGAHKVLICNYSHENKNFNPVWDCREIEAKQDDGDEEKATAAR